MTGLIWLASILVLFLPGALVAAALGLTGPRDRLSRAALYMSLGLACWPIVLLWSTTLGLRFGRTSARLAFASLAAGALAIALKRFAAAPAPAGSGVRAESPVWAGLFVVLAALAVGTRLAQVDGVVLPPWVDSVHHTMIVRLLVEGGAVPSSYAPFIAGGAPATYHFGFHVPVAALGWILGTSEPFDLAAILLQYGQALNALSLLALYAAGRELFASRRAGFFAAAFGTLVLWFPAYYTAWGRYPQLAGLLILPSFAAQLRRGLSGRDPRALAAASVLGAGLFLVHVRVAFFAALLALVLFGASRWSRRRALALAAAGLGALALSSPWVLRLLLDARVHEMLAPRAAGGLAFWREYNSVPRDLLWTPHAAPLLSVASGGVSALAGIPKLPMSGRLAAALWGSAIFVLLRREERRSGIHGSTRRLGHGLLVLCSWCGGVVVLLNLERVGLPPLRIAPNSAAVIAAFLPLAIAAGGVTAWVSGRVLPCRPVWCCLLVAGLGICGASQQLEVVTPKTLLAERADMGALRFVRSSTPPGALFAVRGRTWLGGVYAGTDAGYWISVLTDRPTLLPPSLYRLAGADAALDARLIDDLSEADSYGPSLHARLKSARVQFLYVGAMRSERGAAVFLRSPLLKPVYRDGAVHVFRLL